MALTPPRFPSWPRSTCRARRSWAWGCWVVDGARRSRGRSIFHVSLGDSSGRNRSGPLPGCPRESTPAVCPLRPRDGTCRQLTAPRPLQTSIPPPSRQSLETMGNQAGANPGNPQRQAIDLAGATCPRPWLGSGSASWSSAAQKSMPTILASCWPLFKREEKPNFRGDCIRREIIEPAGHVRRHGATHRVRVRSEDGQAHADAGLL